MTLLDTLQDSTRRGAPFPPVPPFFRHLWLIFAAMMLVNIAVWRRASRRYVAAGWYTDAEASRFFRNVALWIVGYALVAELFILSSGSENFFCAAFHPGRTLGIVGTVINLVVWALLLRWVWLGKGAETLARFGPAGRRGSGLAERPYDVRIVRGVMTLLVLWSIVASVLVFSGLFPVPWCVS